MKRFILYFILSMVLTATMTATGVTLKSPNGGETWMIGSKKLITWNPVNPGNIRLVLFKGNVNLGIIASNIPESDGEYLWTVGIHSNGTAVPGNDYKILVRTIDGNYKDKSDHNFTIMPVIKIPPNLKILRLYTPNGGEILNQGNDFLITWKSLGYSGNVKLILLKNNQIIGTITTGIPLSDKQFNWSAGKITESPTPFGGYGFKVRIKLIGQAVKDESDSNFSIISP